MSACAEGDVQNTQSQQLQEKTCNFGSDEGDIVVLPWPLRTCMQLRSAGMIQSGVLLQMNPTGFLKMHKYCPSKQIMST